MKLPYGVPRNAMYLFGCSHHKDHRILGSVMGPPISRNYHFSSLKGACREYRRSARLCFLISRTPYVMQIHPLPSGGITIGILIIGLHYERDSADPARGTGSSSAFSCLISGPRQRFLFHGGKSSGFNSETSNTDHKSLGCLQGISLNPTYPPYPTWMPTVCKHLPKTHGFGCPKIRGTRWGSL